MGRTKGKEMRENREEREGQWRRGGGTLNGEADRAGRVWGGNEEGV